VVIEALAVWFGLGGVMSLIGMDIGTTGCKTILFACDGKIVGHAVREYQILTPKPDWAEQDAETVWRLAAETLKEAVLQAKGDPPTALALSVQGEAIIPVNKAGKALRPAILGMDTRTVEENRWLNEKFGAQVLYARTGMPLHTINTLPKLLWLKKNESQIYAGAHQFLLYEDYILKKLGGEASISHCLASRTQLYDIRQGRWADDLLEQSGIDASKLARLSPVRGGIIGTMPSNLAKTFGINGQLFLVSGGHDQACAALGSGVVDDGSAMVSTGTAEVVEVAMRSPAMNDVLRDNNISVYRHVIPGLFLAMTLNHSGGLLLRWYRDQMCKQERDRAQKLGQDAYDLILEQAPPEPTDLMVLPHFAGSGTPYLDTSSKGAFLGLTFATTQAMIAKAIIEGLTYELKLNLDLLRKAGIAINALHAVGGGARSPIWLQLKADICQLPVAIPAVTESACLGAALLAGVATGVYRNYQEAVAATVKIHKTIIPDLRNGATYKEKFEIYRKVYPSLLDLHRSL
jgi:xylulokinase